MQTNTYHRYLHLPFTIEPIPIFEEQGNEIRHFYINDYSFPEMENLISDLGLMLSHKEVFYTPPFSKIPIHTDHDGYTNHVKINITWGPEEGVIQWWKSDKTKILEGVNGNKNGTNDYHNNLCADEKDCEFLYEANTNKPSLVNAGILHSTKNPTSQGRWTLCFAPINKFGQFIHWNSALEIFKNYL